MLKRQWSGMLAAACAALIISGCGGGGGGGSGGSGAAPPPVLASAVPGDGQVTLTWNTSPGLYYWVWWIQSTLGVTIGPSGNAVGSEVNTMPPFVMSSLLNGLPYSFAINSHAGDPNGPGGGQSNSLPATPRYAGNNWVPCTASGGTCPPGAPTLYGVSFGDNAGLLGQDNGSLRFYLAVGSGGSMFTSVDSRTWTPLPPQPVCTPPAGGALRATDYGWGVYVVVGDNGTLCFSGLSPINPTGVGLAYAAPPTYTAANASWYPPTTLPPNLGTPNYYAVTTNQNGWAALGGAHVVVGSKGTILWSGDGENWAAPIGSSIPANDLYGVAFNFCGLAFWSWVSVGANGNIIATPDLNGATSWTNAGIKTTTTQNLRGVACTPNSMPVLIPGYPPLFFLPLWVAAGDGGVLLNSIDGMNWTTPTNFTIDNVHVTAFPVGIRALNFGTQFVAIGDSGAIFTSFDGATWNSQVSNAGNNTLNAITQPQGTTIPNGFMGAVPYGYTVVGSGGITTLGR